MEQKEHSIATTAKAEAGRISLHDELIRQQIRMGFTDIMQMAKSLQQSKFFPPHVDTPEKALAIMMTGRDLGIPFTFALQAISVIKGRPCLEGKLLLALVYRTREVEKCKIDDQTEGRVVVTIKRKGMDEFVATWTIDKANKLGITKGHDKNGREYVKDNWKNQPQNMLRWRAISEACRFTFPDAISGCYIAEEIADDVVIDVTTGKVEEVQVHPVKTDVPAPGEERSLNQTAAADIADEMLGEWLIPAGIYKGRSLKDVINDTTRAGRMKGYEYLAEMAETAKDPDAREVISRYIAILKKAGDLPEEGYDTKDVPNLKQGKGAKADATVGAK